MDRRKSIKSIILGGAAAGLAINCKPGEGENATNDAAAQVDEKHFGRTPAEKELIAKLNAEQFFSEHHKSTLEVLCALIVPANDKFGSATDSGVVDFIEFMAKDNPSYQTPLKGGLMWLDHKSNTDYNSEFKSATEEQQKTILDGIAWIKEGEQATFEQNFFSQIRNLTVSGYFTSKMGLEDLGYKGNTPNVWDGVPADVLKKHGKSYSPEWVAKCLDVSKRNDIAEWDDDMNLIT